MGQAETKICTLCERDFVIDADDAGFYDRLGVPVPKLCPGCRFERRTVWRNEKTLYKRECDLCRDPMIAMYHPDGPYKVYCRKCWHSDEWDPMSYGHDYDPYRPFLEQLGELIQDVPKANLYMSTGIGPVINTDYANLSGAVKDCYLVFNTGPAENSAYSRGLSHCRDTYDTYFADGAERVYEGVNVEKSSGIAFGQNIFDCLDSWLLMDCTGCQNCFGTVNARHGSSLFFNEKLSKEEWQKRVAPLLGSYKEMQALRRRFEEHALKFPRRENANFKCVNSTGNYLFECKNCRDCFESAGGENLRYCFAAKFAKDSYDILGHGRKAELFLETVSCGIGTRVICSWLVEGSQNIEYSLALTGSEDCFGCEGLKKGKYCILNKRYEPEEYERLRSRIVEELKQAGEYGLFFPPQLAPFAYNESIGWDNRPLDREQALIRGFRWQEDIPETRGKETMKPEDIPDRIQDVPESILNEILACVDCGRNYRLIKMEFEMYRKALIPVPRQCFNCRHDDRVRRRGPLELHDRSCAKCSKAIRTPYAPDRPEIVYCEQCYQQEVV